MADIENEDAEYEELVQYAPRHGLVSSQSLMPQEKWILGGTAQPVQTALKHSLIRFFHMVRSHEPQISEDIDKERSAVVREAFHDLAEKMCAHHPNISVYEGIFAGLPHIKGVRLSVTDVLSHLFVLGSVHAIVERYAPHVTEDQIKDAIAYAQDFLEAALQTRSEADGRL
jgi:uncharacterized protein (DUF433 family)